MRVLILGGDGYLGWPTAMRFSGKGHDVAVVDNFNRRRWVEGQGSDSLTPIASLTERVEAWREVSGKTIDVHVGDIAEGTFVADIVRDLRSRHDHPLRRAAVRPVVDAVDRQRRRDAAGQRDRLAQAAVGDARVHPRRASDQARHDGRVRHAEHRHRRGLHRDRAQRPPRRAAVPQGSGLALPPVQGARLAQPALRLPGLGPARHRPQPGRGVRDRDSRDQAGRATR